MEPNNQEYSENDKSYKPLLKQNSVPDDHADSDEEIFVTVNVEKPKRERSSSVISADSQRRPKKTAFYLKTDHAEIADRIRRDSLYNSFLHGSVGQGNDEVALVPLLIGRHRSVDDEDDEDGEDRVGAGGAGADDASKPVYNVTYLDLMAMQMSDITPSDRVLSILKRRLDYEALHQYFCELEVWETDDKWRQRGRWVKYEESLEESGDRWSKPYVSMLSLEALFALRKIFLTGTVILDMTASDLPDIIDQMLADMVNNKQLNSKDTEQLREMLLSQHEHGLPNYHCCSCLSRCKNCMRNQDSDRNKDEKSMISFNPKFNEDFLRKIPPGCEAVNILVGEADFLKQPVCAFVRLRDGITLDSMPEVKIPTRFIFVCLGPYDPTNRYSDLGRATATIMSDEVFREIAFYAEDRSEILAGVDEFLSHASVLPPGKFDPEERIEPPFTAPSQKHRLHMSQSSFSLADDDRDMTLKRTGRLFGGLVLDIKRRYRHYLSDITDAINLQCVASFIFMYIACLTPCVTIGGLMGVATENNIGAIEALISGAICGMTWHLFSGQPLTIVGATGPLLVFEKIMFPICKSYGLNYLAFRFWTGMWIAVILLFMVMFDLSFLVRYITRFTEEGFAMLIALIFIVEAFKKLLHIMDEFPVDWHPDDPRYHDYTCFCRPQNESQPFDILDPEIARNLSIDPWILAHYKDIPVLKVTGEHSHSYNGTKHQWDAIPMTACEPLGGFLMGSGCDTPHYVADVFFFSCSLFLCTFAISIVLKGLRTSRYGSTRIRSFLSDFAVPIAILSMSVLDHFVGIHTPKLTVPQKIRPTREDRGWIVNPLDNPLWCIAAAIVPALLGAVLVFMDQQITAVIVNRREHKLKKGCGYHLDLLIIACQIAACSVIGTPWMVAATMESINHVRSLSCESKTTVPGERPKFLGVREQRVTGFLAFLMIGSSAFLSMVLQFIPMPVLFGVFFFMGISALRNIQLVQRIMIMFMPNKYQPDYLFLRHVKLRRVYLFTAIQILCLVGLWAIKMTKSISILFPLMVLALCFIRKAMDFVFSQHELYWLDDILPETIKKEVYEDEEINIEIKQLNESNKGIEMSDVRRTSYCSDTNSILKRNRGVSFTDSNGTAKVTIAEPEETSILLNMDQPLQEQNKMNNDENANRIKDENDNATTK